MTRVVFFEDADGLHGFEAHGHSGFAKRGEDIVCAAISALTQATVMGLSSVLGLAVDVSRDDEKGYLRCILPSSLGDRPWSDSQVLLRTLYISLSAIENEYPNFLSIEEVQPS